MSPQKITLDNTKMLFMYIHNETTNRANYSVSCRGFITN